MKRFVFLLMFVLASCQTDKPVTVVAGGGAKEQELIEKAKKLETDLATLRKTEHERLSKVVASNEVIDESATRIPVSNEQKAVKAESVIIAENTKDVEVLANDRADAQARKAAYWEGRFKEADELTQQAVKQATTLNRQLSEQKAAFDKEISEVKKIATDAQAEISAQKNRYEARISELNKAIAEAEDRARKERIAKLSWALLGLGTLFSVAAAGLLIATQGKEFLRAGLAGACAFAAFSCYWTMNQPWFKWMVWGAGTVIVVAIIVFLYLTWKDQHKKVALTKRSVEADEAEDTVTRMLDVLDDLPDGDATLLKISGTLNDTNKALLNELRAEKQRQKAVTPISTP